MMRICQYVMEYMMEIWKTRTISQQEHPRGSIVMEPQGLHQDGLNVMSYNGLKTTIIVAQVYDIF